MNFVDICIQYLDIFHRMHHPNLFFTKSNGSIQYYVLLFFFIVALSYESLTYYSNCSVHILHTHTHPMPTQTMISVMHVNKKMSTYSDDKKLHESEKPIYIHSMDSFFSFFKGQIDCDLSVWSGYGYEWTGTLEPFGNIYRITVNLSFYTVDQLRMWKTFALNTSLKLRELF